MAWVSKLARAGGINCTYRPTDGFFYLFSECPENGVLCCSHIYPILNITILSLNISQYWCVVAYTIKAYALSIAYTLRPKNRPTTHGGIVSLNVKLNFQPNPYITGSGKH